MSTKNRSKGGIIGIIFSACALVISSLSFYYSIFGTPGTVKPIKPSGFAILRDNKSIFFKPSDHILLPIEWQNTSGREMHISEPYIELREFIRENQIKKETGVRYTFLLAGEFPDLSIECLEKPYSIMNSFILPKHTISKKILLFHNEYWWDKKTKDKGYNLRFVKGKEYKVFIGYNLNLEKQGPIYFFDMWIDYSLPEVGAAEVPAWDFWYLSEPLSRQQRLEKD